MSITELFDCEKRIFDSHNDIGYVYFDDCEYELYYDHYVLMKINKKIVELPESIYGIPVTEIGIIRSSNYDINEIHLLLNENVKYEISIDFNKLGLIKILTCNVPFRSRQIVDVVNINGAYYIYNKKRDIYMTSDKDYNIIKLFDKIIE